MSLSFKFAPEAERDLREIAAYLRKNFPGKWKPSYDKMVKSCRILVRHPLLGRPGDRPDTREYIQPELPYILIYRVEAERLVILRIYHTSRQPFPLLRPS